MQMFNTYGCWNNKGHRAHKSALHAATYHFPLFLVYYYTTTYHEFVPQGRRRGIQLLHGFWCHVVVTLHEVFFYCSPYYIYCTECVPSPQLLLQSATLR